jgi:hypothetical protein
MVHDKIMVDKALQLLFEVLRCGYYRCFLCLEMTKADIPKCIVAIIWIFMFEW